MTILTICAAMLCLSAGADAAAVRYQPPSPPIEYTQSDLGVTQGGGKSLPEAVESVRRQGNVERIISADTRVEGKREVHHIRYQTKDGKVRTVKVPGRTRN